MKKYLVAYASKHGATAEIAKRIADILRNRGYEVESKRALSVRDISGYDGVVAGSAMYIGLWRKEAVRFLKKNIEQLSKLPVWLFVSGPTSGGDPNEVLKGAIYPKSLKPVIEGVKPRSITCFGGKIENKALGPFERWIVRNVNAKEGDFRDWKAIESWVGTIS